jgi:protein gp37
MAKNTGINWTDHTANFWWGCQKVSEGCKNCYAETLSKRYGKRVFGPAETTEREYKQAMVMVAFRPLPISDEIQPIHSH